MAARFFTQTLLLHTMTSLRSIAKIALSLIAAGGLLSQAAFAQDVPRTAAPEGASTYIISPEDGATIEGGKVHVVFGLKGMGVAPAGIEYPDTGHHHLLVNAEELPPVNMPIPADENHIHFGMGQTETTLDLEPGVYTLQLLVGDKNHIPHDAPVMSEKITVTVE